GQSSPAQSCGRIPPKLDREASSRPSWSVAPLVPLFSALPQLAGHELIPCEDQQEDSSKHDFDLEWPHVRFWFARIIPSAISSSPVQAWSARARPNGSMP